MTSEEQNIFTCILCRSTTFNILAKMTQEGEKYELVECANCKLIQWYPIPRLRRDESYANISSESFAIGEQRRSAAVINLLSKYITFNSHMVGLDIGCGCGNLLNEINKKYGCAVVGVENQKSFVDYAQSNFGLTVFQGLFEEMEIKGAYDFIIMYEVLQYMELNQLLVEKIINLLSQNGKLFIISKDQDNRIRSLKNISNYYLHIPQYFSLQHLEKIFTRKLKMVGFQFVDMSLFSLALKKIYVAVPSSLRWFAKKLLKFSKFHNVSKSYNNRLFIICFSKK